MCRRSGAHLGSSYGSGTGQIWLDDLRCSGNETSLLSCPHSGLGIHNCDHIQDVSIACISVDGTFFVDY